MQSFLSLFSYIKKKDIPNLSTRLCVIMIILLLWCTKYF